MEVLWIAIRLRPRSEARMKPYVVSCAVAHEAMDASAGHLARFVPALAGAARIPNGYAQVGLITLFNSCQIRNTRGRRSVDRRY